MRKITKPAALSAAILLGMTAFVAPAFAGCLEEIVSVQEKLQAKFPPPKAPPEQAVSADADMSHQPTPSSLAAAGLTQPDSGAFGALNQAMNLQAAGDEKGCLAALAQARRLGGV